MSRSTAGLISILSILILIMTLNMVSGIVFRSTQIDLTERNLFTISEGSKTLVSRLEEPIDLTFYFSETLATDYNQIHAYGLRVRDLLQRLAAKSNGQLRLEVIDPEPYSLAEDEATAYGLTGAQVETGERSSWGSWAPTKLTV